jgi:hypothetical protein
MLAISMSVCIVRRDGAHISTLLLLVAWDPNADQVHGPSDGAHPHTPSHSHRVMGRSMDRDGRSHLVQLLDAQPWQTAGKGHAWCAGPRAAPTQSTPAVHTLDQVRPSARFSNVIRLIPRETHPSMKRHRTVRVHFGTEFVDENLKLGAAGVRPVPIALGRVPELSPAGPVSHSSSLVQAETIG